MFSSTSPPRLSAWCLPGNGWKHSQPRLGRNLSKKVLIYEISHLASILSSFFPLNLPLPKAKAEKYRWTKQASWKEYFDINSSSHHGFAGITLGFWVTRNEIPLWSIIWISFHIAKRTRRSHLSMHIMTEWDASLLIILWVIAIVNCELIVECAYEWDGSTSIYFELL